MSTKELLARLESVSSADLIDVLRARGLVIAAFSPGDLEAEAENDHDFAHLTDEERFSAQVKVFDGSYKVLGDLVVARGNDFLSEAWSSNRDAVLAEVEAARVPSESPK